MIARLFGLLFLVCLSGCGFIEGFATPYAYFPRDREADVCPAHYAGRFASYREAMEALQQGSPVRRHSWMIAAPGELCLNGVNAAKPFLHNYDVATGRWGRFMFRGHGLIVEVWEPTDDDKVANDWETA